MGRIKFDLFSASNTIYHRAAMGGLAGTIDFWNANGGIQGITATYDDSTITIDFDDEYFAQVGFDKICCYNDIESNLPVKEILDFVKDNVKTVKAEIKDCQTEKKELKKLLKSKSSKNEKLLIKSDLIEICQEIKELTERGEVCGLSVKILKDKQYRIVWAFIQTVFEKSFKINDGILDIVGQLILNESDIKIATHNCICNTFIQHNKVRTVDKTKTNRLLNFNSADDDLDNNCMPAGLYLLDSKLSCNFVEKDGLYSVKIPQYIVPGLTAGSVSYTTDWKEAFLLKFFIAGCFYYSVGFDNCIIIPSVVNLENFVISTEAYNRNNVAKLNRYEPSIADVILSLDLQLNLNDFFKQNVENEIVDGLTVITMGLVPWDKNQQNIKSIYHVNAEFDNLELYKESRRILAKKRVEYVKKNKTNYFVGFENTFCSFVANNIVNKKHWCYNLKVYIGQKFNGGDLSVFEHIMMSPRKRMEFAKMVQFASDDDKMVIEIATLDWFALY